MNADPPSSSQGSSRKDQDVRGAAVMTVIFFIIGLSVVLSYDWSSPNPQFRQDAGFTILFGILVAAIIFISARFAAGRDGPLGFRLRFCPECGRQIRFDVNVCPYCKH